MDNQDRRNFRVAQTINETMLQQRSRINASVNIYKMPLITQMEQPGGSSRLTAFTTIKNKKIGGKSSL